MENQSRPRPVVLVILDGWGVSPTDTGNAIAQANIPFIKSLSAKYPHTTVSASGESVGLPHGEDGNTETGHLNIGAGKIVYQDLPRINQSIADGTFFKNEQILASITHTKKNNSTLHLLGLVGSGGVHSSVDHLYALLNMCAQNDCSDVAIHAITDGRDSPPTSGINYISQLQSHLKQSSIGKLSTIVGRYYAMDRDHNWDRTEVAYNALTKGDGVKVQKLEPAIHESYQQQVTDEFIKPIILADQAGNPMHRIIEGDAVIFFNFRIDRPRQLTKAFVLPDLNYVNINTEGFDPYAIKYHHTHLPVRKSEEKTFNRADFIKNLYFVTMTEYERDLPVAIAFPPELVEMPLGRVVSEMGLRQLRMAETEKERFVTFYFNGQREDSFPGEDHIIIPSPQVPTYDQKPEMSSVELTDTLCDRIQAELYDLIIVNYANPDMVAHSGNLNAAIMACEVTDKNLAKLHDVVLSVGGALVITADHGNIEEMIDLKPGSVDTKHSTNPVPVYICGSTWSGKHINMPSGILGDIAPTVLSIMNLPIPSSMTGRSLLAGI
jgi:2,3-bisphosphoglycerate-independent phosphoglycerate mutase